jgi:predicted RNA-binding protein with PIN domain
MGNKFSSFEACDKISKTFEFNKHYSNDEDDWYSSMASRLLPLINWDIYFKNPPATFTHKKFIDGIHSIMTRSDDLIKPVNLKYQYHVIEKYPEYFSWIKKEDGKPSILDKYNERWYTKEFYANCVIKCINSYFREYKLNSDNMILFGQTITFIEDDLLKNLISNVKNMTNCENLNDFKYWKCVVNKLKNDIDFLITYSQYIKLNITVVFSLTYTHGYYSSYKLEQANVIIKQEPIDPKKYYDVIELYKEYLFTNNDLVLKYKNDIDFLVKYADNIKDKINVIFDGKINTDYKDNPDFYLKYIKLIPVYKTYLTNQNLTHIIVKCNLGKDFILEYKNYVSTKTLLENMTLSQLFEMGNLVKDIM